MTIRFHLDENVSGALALALQRRGIDVTTAPNTGLLGADYREQLNFCRTHNRVIVTHDDDFTRLHASGLPHVGICYCHKDKYSVGELVRALLLVHACLDGDEMHGHLEYL